MSDFSRLWLSAPYSVIHSIRLLIAARYGWESAPHHALSRAAAPFVYLDLGLPYRRQFKRIPDPWHLPVHWMATAMSAFNQDRLTMQMQCSH